MTRLTLSMIVRDAEAMLPACLESLKPVVDEMVIADTGSSDKTPEVAESFGARLIRIPWENDFALARNLALEAVQSEWVITLDADEMLDPEAATRLPPLLNQDVSGYEVEIRNYVRNMNQRMWDRPAKKNDSKLQQASSYPGYTEHENVRLFRRRPEIYFIGCVHESVGPSIRASGGNLRHADFSIHHFGFVADADLQHKKNIIYRDLGRQKIASQPNDAKAHFELGLLEMEQFHDCAQALACFRQAYQLAPKFSLAWFFAGVVHMRLQEDRLALKCFNQAERLGHAMDMTAELTGDAHYNLGEYRKALECYRRSLRRCAGAPAVESKLGLAEIRMGRTEQGLQRIREAVRSATESGELYDRWMAAAVFLGRLSEAATAAESKLATVSPTPRDFLRAASIRVQMRNLPEAVALVRLGLSFHPADTKLSTILRNLQGKLVTDDSTWSEPTDYEPR